MIRYAAIVCAAALCLAGGASSAAAEPPPSETRLVYGTGSIVPIPTSIPHEAGDMVDKRIVPDLRWIAQRYPIYVTDGYSGPLPDGGWSGCHGCHVAGSDHYNGLAVDIVPLVPSSTCDAKWTAITRLALWAEPRQNKPVLPFRWVGYDGDAGHGCGHHLHLSWNHATAKRYALAEWVEVFPAAGLENMKQTRTKQTPKAPKAPPGPSGGISQAPTGGLSPRGD
ncbi:MAG TPA: hypothetical protein VHR18_08170 [Solirubrobacterales bacterium]|nr:hypothetical protein [Solirubrobacterales bacterium]